jgi:GTP cyclohydrolase I
MGHPQSYGIDHYLNDSLFDNPSFPMKKLHHKTLSHTFSKWMTLVGIKDNMHAAIKTPNKILYMMYKEFIEVLSFTKYQKTHKGEGAATESNGQWLVTIPSMALQRPKP